MVAADKGEPWLLLWFVNGKEDYRLYAADYILEAWVGRTSGWTIVVDTSDIKVRVFENTLQIWVHRPAS